MAITIHDVAKKAGVSISTVSKVIHKSPRISEPTADRVRKVMEEMQFQPNSIARAFARQSSGTIGVLMNMYPNSVAESPHAYQVLGGIEGILQENGYLLSISNIAKAEDIRNVMDLMVRAKRIDAFILHSSYLSSQIISFLKTGSVPWVVIGRTETVDPAHWVDVDNRAAGRMAAEHILAIGRSTPVFVGGSHEDGITTKRLTGVNEAFAGRVHTPEQGFLLSGAVDFASGYRVLRERLDNPALEKPDAVICSSNFVAAGAMRAAKDAGLSIPEDIAFIGFDDFPLAPFLEPALTIVDMDMFALGTLAGEAIIEQIKPQDRWTYPRLLAPHLVVRGSTVPGGNRRA